MIFLDGKEEYLYCGAMWGLAAYFQLFAGHLLVVLLNTFLCVMYYGYAHLLIYEERQNALSKMQV